MKPVPVLIPHVPELECVAPLLAVAHANKRYTNYGPLESQLRQRFVSRFQRAGVDSIALFSSGTSALTACLKAFGLSSGAKCLVPSWTFVGTVCAIVHAGLEPVFVDVDPQTWTPPVDVLEEARLRTGARAATIVAPFGGLVEYDALTRYADETGIKIVIDAAAALDAAEKITSGRSEIRLPIMVSLHATKLASALEGGVVVWDDSQAVREMIAWSNFGIFEQAPIETIGLNGKLSEAHAAYGLASLEIWPSVRDRMVELANRYQSLFRPSSSSSVGFAPNIQSRLATSTFNIVAPNLPEAAPEMLAQKGVEVRRWWRNGVHALRAYRNYQQIGLATTERLARTTIGIPFSHDLADEDQAAVVRAVLSILD